MDSALDTSCPFATDTRIDATGFLPPCLLRLATVIEVLGADQARSWLQPRLPKKLVIEPIAEPNGIHAHSLNFSRALALWDIYQSTHDAAYQRTFAKLMNFQMAHPDIWRTEYDNYAHWVAQFGVLAIDRTYGSD